MKAYQNKILVGFLSGKKKIRMQNTLQELQEAIGDWRQALEKPIKV